MLLNYFKQVKSMIKMGDINFKQKDQYKTLALSSLLPLLFDAIQAQPRLSFSSQGEKLTKNLMWEDQKGFWTPKILNNKDDVSLFLFKIKPGHTGPTIATNVDNATLFVTGQRGTQNEQKYYSKIHHISFEDKGPITLSSNHKGLSLSGGNGLMKVFFSDFYANHASSFGEKTDVILNLLGSTNGTALNASLSVHGGIRNFGSNGQTPFDLYMRNPEVLARFGGSLSGDFSLISQDGNLAYAKLIFEHGGIGGRVYSEGSSEITFKDWAEIGRGVTSHTAYRNGNNNQGDMANGGVGAAWTRIIFESGGFINGDVITNNGFDPNKTHQTGGKLGTEISFIAGHKNGISGNVIVYGGEGRNTLILGNGTTTHIGGSVIKNDNGTNYGHSSSSGSPFNGGKNNDSNHLIFLGGKFPKTTLLRLGGNKHQFTRITKGENVWPILDFSSKYHSRQGDFSLLEIGDESSAQISVAATTTPTSATNQNKEDGTKPGLFGSGYTFVLYVDPNSSGASLGGGSPSGTHRFTDPKADRVIIYSAGKEENKTSSTPPTSYLSVLIKPEDLKNLKNGDGIILATVKNSDCNNRTPVSKIKTISTINGGEKIKVRLGEKNTDKDGNTCSSGNSFTSYYLAEAESLGADKATQDAVSSALNVTYDLYLANFNSLSQRMGELRWNVVDHGLWARIFGGAQSSNFGISSEISYTTLQGGYDYAGTLRDARNYIGLALSYSYAQGQSEEVRRNGVTAGRATIGIDNIHSNAVEIAIYDVYIADSGWYNDALIKFSSINSSFTLEQSPQRSKTNNFGLIFSDEVGYRHLFGEKKDFYLEPQLELTLGYLGSSDFQSKLAAARSSFNHLLASQDSILMLRSRFGASLGKIVEEKKQKVNLYFGLFYEYDFIDNGQRKMIQGSGAVTPLSPLASNGRVILNFGSYLHINELTQAYVDVKKSFGKKLSTYLQFNLGVRYNFGRKAYKRLGKASLS